MISALLLMMISRICVTMMTIIVNLFFKKIQAHGCAINLADLDC